ncbi:hypothetical protein OUZ56_011817 [Daphnia magna]|uniref:Uncharacterized protein n=1 Tax=Daphnia magna TaxID=35525 RepID=A0ABQ9Z196_9CRUS|nr:hypothetical protein OUZ56_011817 [Daphnia magna]
MAVRVLENEVHSVLPCGVNMMSICSPLCRKALAVLGIELWNFRYAVLYSTATPQQLVVYELI